jgi:hypothetical protein
LKRIRGVVAQPSGGSLKDAINIIDHVKSDVIQITESQTGKCVKGSTLVNLKAYTWRN